MQNESYNAEVDELIEDILKIFRREEPTDLEAKDCYDIQEVSNEAVFQNCCFVLVFVLCFAVVLRPVDRSTGIL